MQMNVISLVVIRMLKMEQIFIMLVMKMLLLIIKLLN